MQDERLKPDIRRGMLAWLLLYALFTAPNKSAQEITAKLPTSTHVIGQVARHRACVQTMSYFPTHRGDALVQLRLSPFSILPSLFILIISYVSTTRQTCMLPFHAETRAA